MNGVPAVLTATLCEGCDVPLFTGEVCIYHFQKHDGAIFHANLCQVCFAFVAGEERASLPQRHRSAIARSVGYPNTKGGDNG